MYYHWLAAAWVVSYSSYRNCWKTLALLEHMTVGTDYNQFQMAKQLYGLACEAINEVPGRVVTIADT